MSYRVATLVVSDRVSRGEREDGCLPVFESLLAGSVFALDEKSVCSDDPDSITEALRGLLVKEPALIFISGGTGCSARDNTPEVCAALIDNPTPGIDEAIRRFSAEKTALAIYSRAVSGFSDDTLIISLPGSPKAVAEILAFLLPTLEHPLRLRAGKISDCADEQQQ